MSGSNNLPIKVVENEIDNYLQKGTSDEMSVWDFWSIFTYMLTQVFVL